MAAIVEEIAPGYGDDWWFAAFAALWYQEVDQFERARQLADRSLELFPRNASATHPLAHVFYETDDHASGADSCVAGSPTYDRAAPYHCHLSWHLALCELAPATTIGSWSSTRTRSRPVGRPPPVCFFDAASLLWRYEIYGYATGPLPWRAVRDLGRHLLPRPGVPFADGMLALACAARATRRRWPA